MKTKRSRPQTPPAQSTINDEESTDVSRSSARNGFCERRSASVSHFGFRPVIAVYPPMNHSSINVAFRLGNFDRDLVPFSRGSDLVRNGTSLGLPLASMGAACGWVEQDRATCLRCQPNVALRAGTWSDGGASRPFRRRRRGRMAAEDRGRAAVARAKASRGPLRKEMAAREVSHRKANPRGERTTRRLRVLERRRLLLLSRQSVRRPSRVERTRRRTLRLPRGGARAVSATERKGNRRNLVQLCVLPSQWRTSNVDRHVHGLSKQQRFLSIHGTHRHQANTRRCHAKHVRHRLLRMTLLSDTGQTCNVERESCMSAAAPPSYGRLEAQAREQWTSHRSLISHTKREEDSSAVQASPGHKAALRTS